MRRAFLSMAFLLLTAVSVPGASVAIELKSADAVAGKIDPGGFVFEIAGARESAAIVFRVVMTESRGAFADDIP